MPSRYRVSLQSDQKNQHECFILKKRLLGASQKTTTIQHIHVTYRVIIASPPLGLTAVTLAATTSCIGVALTHGSTARIWYRRKIECEGENEKVMRFYHYDRVVHLGHPCASSLYVCE